MSNQFSSDDNMSRIALATACDAQLYVSRTHALDGEMGLSRHNGAFSELYISENKWIPVRHSNIAHNRLKQQEIIIRRICPDNSRDICDDNELRERIAMELAKIVGMCRFSFGDHQYGLNYSHCHLTVKKGVLRDLFIGIRIFIGEIPGLEDFTAALHDSEMLKTQ